MFKFFDLLRAHYRFDQERFICALGVSDNIHKSEHVYVSMCMYIFCISWTINMKYMCLANRIYVSSFMSHYMIFNL